MKLIYLYALHMFMYSSDYLNFVKCFACNVFDELTTLLTLQVLATQTIYFIYTHTVNFKDFGIERKSQKCNRMS